MAIQGNVQQKMQKEGERDRELPPRPEIHTRSDRARTRTGWLLLLQPQVLQPQ